ncbi:MAG TPA: tRNA lysidine(34) synthetase TilS [Terriglobales bacterium]|nr:tRNA lysidine(34) synthetase TilS [Terriglobales bacterium]
MQLAQRVLRHLRSSGLVRAGERVAVAVSGGADSVAMLRLLLELREELGAVLSVAHFHHGIRGADADADEQFVVALAREHSLEFHVGHGNAGSLAEEKALTLEEAARELRQQFFTGLLRERKVDCVATAHTLDDQSETVLMKLLRGAGTRGLAGIFPEQRLEFGRIVRPLLAVKRAELRDYLASLGQAWREDASNADAAFTRNRLRARVLPLLREELNPGVDLSLARMAEIARSEEDYWNEQVARILPTLVLPGVPARGGGRKQTSSQSLSLDLGKFRLQPLAMQRHLLLAVARELEFAMDFEHLQSVIDFASGSGSPGKHRTVELPDGWRVRLLFREFRFERETGTESESSSGYEYRLPVPGEVYVSEAAVTISARICEDTAIEEHSSYNRARSIPLPRVSELVVRNWRSGDRFRTASSSSEKRLKELLSPLHLSPEEKRIWPVVAVEGRLLWVRKLENPRLRWDEGRFLNVQEWVK